MQDRDQENGDRLGEVNKRQKLGVVQYFPGPTQVAADGINGRLACEKAT